MAALISYPAGFLSDRWGRRNILLASFVIVFVAYLGFAIPLLRIVSGNISVGRQGTCFATDKASNRIVALMGGREIRPVSAAGGFLQTASKSVLKELVEGLTWPSTSRWVTGNLIDVHSSTWTVWRYSQPSVICITARLETNEA